jgi:protein-S-isoprenylcysteine O-methyltransferase Ste14
MLVLDLIAMPQLAPALRLGPTWLAGEVIAIALCLIPAQLFYRWTRDDTHLPARAVLLCASFSAIMLGILPTVILAHTGGDWSALAARPAWIVSLALQLLAIPAALGASAVQEFVIRGGGTPVPFDATKRLVTSGAYAYVSNPMQLANSVILLGLGALLASWWLAAAGVMSVIYSAGLAAWDEQRDLGARFGEPWRAYRGAVRAWIPRWRPYATPGRRAVLYVSADCTKCRAIARWFSWRHPVALEIIPAESHPSRDLTRITYDPGDGTRDEQGVAAVARALEHINLAWAMTGMIARLPVVNFVIQAFVDASGGGPQRVARCQIAEHAAVTP